MRLLDLALSRLGTRMKAIPLLCDQKISPPLRSVSPTLRPSPKAQRPNLSRRGNRRTTARTRRGTGSSAMTCYESLEARDALFKFLLLRRLAPCEHGPAGQGHGFVAHGCVTVRAGSPTSLKVSPFVRGNAGSVGFKLGTCRRRTARGATAGPGVAKCKFTFDGTMLGCGDTWACPHQKDVPLQAFATEKSFDGDGAEDDRQMKQRLRRRSPRRCRSGARIRRKPARP